jgi:hypothetical protein
MILLKMTNIFRRNKQSLAKYDARALSLGFKKYIYKNNSTNLMSLNHLNKAANLIFRV